jgi:uncharacterized protein (DUF849 family)
MSPLVKCCLNGARPFEEHPALPRSAADAAREAAAAVAAGAGAIHVHPRDAPGAESLDASVIAEWVGAIHDACPGVPVGVSTGWWIVPDLQIRLAQIAQWREPLPDFASVNLNEEGAPEVARACLQRGVGIEAGLLSSADAESFARWELAGRCVRVLVEPLDADPEQAMEHAAAIEDVLDRAGIGLEQVHHGDGVATWAVAARALKRGHGIRTGLEDTTVLPDGRQAGDNAELVRVAAAMMG